MTAIDETRVHHPPRVRWGVVCGDGEVVWARDQAAARRLLASLVGAIRLVCEQPPGAASQVPARGEGDAPVTSPVVPGVPQPVRRTAGPHPR